MSIPADVLADVAGLKTSLENSAPLEEQSKIVVQAVTNQALSVATVLDQAVTAATGNLDAPDPVLYAGALPQYLLDLVGASTDQAKLVETRGYVGRVLFYLQKAPLA